MAKHIKRKLALAALIRGSLSANAKKLLFISRIEEEGIVLGYATWESWDIRESLFHRTDSHCQSLWGRNVEFECSATRQEIRVSAICDVIGRRHVDLPGWDLPSFLDN